MNTKLITKPLLELVKEASFTKPILKGVLSRVMVVLKKYSLSKNRKLSELKLPNLFVDDGNICKGLQKFINSIPCPVKRSAKRHRKYKEEIRSNLRRLFGEIVYKGRNIESGSDLLP